MAKLGAKHHLKRLSAPRLWKIPRKTFKWVTKTIPGPHKKGNYIPLIMVIRDILGYAKNIKEAKFILSNKMVKINGKPRTNIKYPVGLMDVIEIPETKEYFRLLLVPNRGFVLHPIPKKELSVKLCKIEGKCTVKGGHIQLNLHDGSNILIRVKDPTKPVEDVYKVKDSLLISIPNNKIKKHIQLKEGILALTVAGKNLGYVGKIEKIEERFGPFASIVTLSNDKIGVFQTALDYVFPIGLDKPLISMPEVD
ncbi:MAG: 30S ribosomal protein S4e [Candidatus Odinarchaeia archaeon]